MEEAKKQLVLLTTTDVMELTTWSKSTVQKVMSQPDFPVIKIGKENQVLLESLKEYVSTRKDLRGEE